ncbi:hypothetical protein [Bacillus sp. WMMC1349]|nr:hypothetical protein [Bacillus sp. WMMC1349]
MLKADDDDQSAFNHQSALFSPAFKSIIMFIRTVFWSAFEAVII